MLSAGCLQLFAVSQSVPGPQSVKLGHCAVLAWHPACRPASLKRMIYFIYA